MSIKEQHTATQGAEFTYFSHLRAGNWKIQRCEQCHAHVYYPRQLCPHCHTDQFTWVTPTGKGRVYSLSHVYQQGAISHIVLLVDLEEGVRMMAMAGPEHVHSLHIGSRVKGEPCTVSEDGKILFVPEP